MSTGSWDDSSNLVKDLPSPPPSGDDVFRKKAAAEGTSSASGPSTASEAFPEKTSSSDSTPSSSKHSSPHHKHHGLFSKKGKAAKSLSYLIKASKEGARRRAKSPSKSPSKSSSKEGFADDSEELTPVDESVKAKSEQWQAFLQMQDRIKVNVMKTQQNLSKLTAGRISPSGRISPAKHDQLKDNDENEDTEETEPSQCLNLGAEDAATIDEQAEGKGDSVAEADLLGSLEDLTVDTEHLFKFGDQEDNELSNLLQSLNRLPQFEVTPAGSSDYNQPEASDDSFFLDMDKDKPSKLLAFEKPVPPSTPVDPMAEEIDLLGLGFEPSSSVGSLPAAPIINDDLLGLEDFLSQPAASSSVPSSSSVDGFSGDWFGSAYSSNQSSLCSSPISFDPDFLAEQGQFASDSTAVSDLARTLVDDFLQWGAETEKRSSASPYVLSKNPFASDSDQPETSYKSNAFNPFATIVDSDETETIHSLPPYTAERASSAAGLDMLDPFMASSVTAGDTSVASAPSANAGFDPFGCVMSLDHNANPHSEEEPAQQQPSVFSSSDIMSESKSQLKLGPRRTSLNPFIDSDTELDPAGVVNSSQAPAGVVNSSQAPAAVPLKAPITVNFDDDDFFASKAAASGVKQNVDSIWGTAEPGTPSQAFNPFENDLFTATSIPSISTDDDGGSSGSVKPINPFLTASFENITAVPTTSAYVHQLFLASTDELDKIGAGTESTEPAADPFDPFSSVPSKLAAANQVDAAADLLGGGEPSASASAQEHADNEHQDEDEDEMGFKLTIRATPVVKDGSAAAPMPVLPPPPKRPKSPPSRENPFDKESPPEENFANFEVEVEKEKEKPKDEANTVEPRGIIKSMSSETSSSYDEDEILEPLEPFRPTFAKSCWKLMVRQPVKKKLAGNRYWKTVYVKLAMNKDGPVLRVYESEDCEGDVFQELPLQPCYSVSELTVQQFDQYGKIHTVKIQYIFYRERVGIKPERITPSFVKKPKATMVLDHAPQVSELLKFGSLDQEEIRSFVWEMEDAFMKLDCKREKTLTYTKDEIQAEVWDEYMAIIDKDGHTLNQKARIRCFILAFLTGMPACELGMNDRMRKGKEVVGRHDIIPVRTEDWIRIEDPEFHAVVDLDTYEKSSNIRFHPLDACQFELLRFRVRPRENRELPLQLRIQQIMKDRHFEIRCDLLVTGYHAFSKKCGQFPCEDIEVHFRVPEKWIYYFRYERKFKYGSLKSMTRKPGKIKGLERLTMMAQGLLSTALMEASVGTAKYEHLFRSVVWRIPRLPERNQGAYKNHLFVLRLDLGPHDEIPDTFEEWANVEFNMPATTASKAQVRSISIENPNPPEKWVRYIAKYQYRVQIDNKVETSSDHEGDDD